MALLSRRHAALVACGALSLGLVMAGPVTGAMASAGLSASAGRPAPNAPEAPALSVASVTPDTSLVQQWRRFGDTSGQGGWAGADGTYSTPLPGGPDAWLFNDTFLGPVNADESLPSTAEFIHNSLVLTSPGARRILTTVTGGGTRQQPQSLVGPTPSPPTPAGTDPYWYWNTDGIADHGHLYIFESRIGPTDTPPPFDFGQTGMAIATLSLPTLHAESVTPTYGGADVSWGVQLLRVGPWIYIYGVSSGSPGKNVQLARARSGHLLGPWHFYTGSGWSNNPGTSAPLLNNVGASYSVTKVGGEYVLATTDSYLNPQIYLYTSTSPTGPFTHRTQIYTAPEAGGNIYVYNVAAHPELTGPDTLVLSYNVNSFSLADLFANINNNRARFLTVTFTHR